MPNKDIERIKKILAGNPPTPALESLYYGPTPAQDVISERQAGPRELLAEKLQAQLERFGAPTASAKRGAQKITGYGYPMGVADITPAGIPLWAYEGGQSLAKAAEAAGQGEYGTAALEGAAGALGLLPAAKPAAAVTTAAGKEALRRIDRAMMGGEGKLGTALSAIRPQFAVAYHGTPHQFEKFDMSKIGTGEGAQAYGHGLYFAEAPGVAGQYKASTAANMYQTTKGTIRSSDLVDEIFKEAGDVPKGLESSYRAKANEVVRDLIMGESAQEIANKIASSRYGKTYAPLVKAVETLSPSPAQGALYKVDIPDEAVARMLDWDKPLSEQHPDVQNVLREMWVKAKKSFGGIDPNADPAAAQVHHLYSQHRGGSPEKVAEELRSAGIPGIKYLDEGSRAAGEGTRNFVLFSDDLPRILEVNEKPTGAKPWAPGEWGGGFQYPQAEALETARKNAVTMLGLPENNTAMDRARAMGFEGGWMHGTNKDFPAFQTGDTYMITDPAEASRYSEIASRTSGGANVMPLMTRGQAVGPKEYDAAYNILSKERSAPYVPSKDVHASLSKAGVSGYKEGDTQIIFDPSRIRSRFAAFDPARINENDLLGYAQPAILPFTAGAGALGGLGLSQIKERPSDKKKGDTDGE